MSTTQPPSPKPAPRPKTAAEQAQPARPNPRSKAPPPPASPQASESATQASAGQDAQSADAYAGRSRLPGYVYAVPTSLIFHLFLFVLLALITFANPDLRQEIFQTSSLEKEEIEELEDVEFENQEIEVIDATSFDTPELDMGVADLGDITAPVTSVKSDVSVHESVEAVEVGQLFGSEGLGMAETGNGNGATSFFGVRTEGSHFMYVVDNSNSMNNGKFENAVFELMNSIDQLSETSFFYIIFYSDAEYPLFYPDTMPRWVRATPENKHKVRYWLDTVHRCLQTRGEGAMAHAMKLRPDVLYLLGDGAFTDKAIPKTMELEGKVDVVINTLGFNMRPEHTQDFQRVAKAFGGNFRGVQVDPRMKKISQQKNRPKNNARNGDWGINLGKGKKKK